jgi:hypothetical protein
MRKVPADFASCVSDPLADAKLLMTGVSGDLALSSVFVLRNGNYGGDFQTYYSYLQLKAKSEG